MFTGTDFIYDDRLASEFGLTVVRIGSTTNAQEPFGLRRDILETKRLDGINSFHGMSQRPLEFSIILAREYEWDYYTRMEVSRWLFQNNYKELINSDFPEIIYNAIIYGDTQIGLVGNIPRYITINVRCDAPWGWTETYEYEHDCNTTLAIEIDNLSNLNLPIYAEVEVTLQAGTSFEIQFDTDKVYKFMNATYGTDTYNLVVGEIIYVDNSKKIILSDEAGSEDKRIKNFIKDGGTKEMSDWFYLIDGTNDITLVGNALFKIRVKFPMIA